MERSVEHERVLAGELPENLRLLLLDELDEYERLLWCGQSLPEAVFRAMLPSALFSTFAVLLLGTLPTLLILRVCSDIARAISLSGLLRMPWQDIAIAVLLFALCVMVAGALWYTMTMPSRAARRARSSVCAVTSTRVFEVTLQEDGRRQMIAIEPGHPLHIRRVDRRDGRSTIDLYPRQDKTASKFRLLAVRDGRRLDKLIRATFDP